MAAEQHHHGHHHHKVGGPKDAQEPNADAQEVFEAVKAELLKQAQVEEAKLVLVRTQLVAGMNYWFKVQGGNKTFHAKVFRDLKKHSVLQKLVEKADADELATF